MLSHLLSFLDCVRACVCVGMYCMYLPPSASEAYYNVFALEFICISEETANGFAVVEGYLNASYRSKLNLKPSAFCLLVKHTVKLFSHEHHIKKEADSQARLSNNNNNCPLLNSILHGLLCICVCHSITCCSFHIFS